MFVQQLGISEYQYTLIPGLINELRIRMPDILFESYAATNLEQIPIGLVSESAVENIKTYLNGVKKCRVWVFPIEGILHMGITV